MLIDEIMQEIWKPVAIEYKGYYDNAMKMQAEEIFQKMKHIEMTTIEYPDPYPNLNLLATSGCYHTMKDGKFSGCSMCNHNVSDLTEYYAYINALRSKDVELYAKLVRISFENKRGVINETSTTEIVTGCDSLNEVEFPEQVYRELFGDNGVFQKRPFRYSFEVRADSVTKDNLDMAYRYIKKGRTYYEIGVEVEDDWIRNHWLNKGVTNQQIENAIGLIHEKGGKVNANVLIGIPGLTEQQSIDLFVKTVRWLVHLNVDRITFFPLNRKKYTLNGFLYEKMSDNRKLKHMGIVQEEHTGIPWLFTIVKALAAIFEEIPELHNKFGIAQYTIFDGSDILPYNFDRRCECNDKLFHIIDRLIKKTDIKELLETRKVMQKDPCYREYEKLLKQQGEVEIKDTIKTQFAEIAKELWPDLWKSKVNEFEYELDQFVQQTGIGADRK